MLLNFRALFLCIASIEAKEELKQGARRGLHHGSRYEMMYTFLLLIYICEILPPLSCVVLI
jgi:hypothetical protein